MDEPLEITVNSVEPEKPARQPSQKVDLSNLFHQMRMRSDSAATRERIHEIVRSIKSAPQSQAGSVQQAIHAHIEKLQGDLGPDQELVVYIVHGPQLIRVLQVGFPNWHVAILVGMDNEGNATSVITNVHVLQLVYKVLSVEPSRKPIRIGFVLPNEPDELQGQS